MKKVLSIILLGSLILSGVGTTAIQITKTEGDKKGMIFLDDELDQSQTSCNHCLFVCSYLGVSQQEAQSFIPRKGILTRAQLYIMRYEVYPPIYPYYVSIRKSLTGDTLAETSVNPEDIPLYNYAWIEFNFDDISVDVGETYYIVSYTIEDEQNGVYVWGASDSNPYPYGMEYYSTDVGNTWIEKPNVDLCFKTYGLENDPPNKPSIDGETNGKVGVEYEYTFETTDPEGLQVWYYIEWGDNTNTGWIGHYPSGEEITKSHSWSKKDTYTIRCKAKDPYGAEGEWGELEVTMPMNQQTLSNWWFYRFLQIHPRMFPIIRQLLGL